MMRYRFRIEKPNGKVVNGIIVARDEHEARKRVTSDGALLLVLSPRAFPALSLRVLLPAESVHSVMKQLSLMVGAALPLRESLALVVKQQTSSRIRQVLEDLYRQVCQGVPLSQAMAQHRRYFDPLCCAVIEAGEWSGDLSTALSRYADYLDEQQKLRSSIRQALSYPLLLLFVSCIVIGVLLTVAVPKIVAQLSISGIELPWSTRLVLWLGETLRHGAPIALFITLGLGLAGLRLYRKPAIRRKCHAIFLKIPGGGRLLKHIQQVRLLMTLSILCVTAVPMADALRLACAAVSNLWLREKTTRAVQSLIEGAGFTQALEKEAILPGDLLALLHAGELGGRLNEVLSYLAKVQREELQQRLIGLVKLLEPLLIFSLGLVVLLVFMAIIQPMLTMNSMSF
jgi:general secretion pathway protein F